MLNEFGARGREENVRRGGRIGGLPLRLRLRGMRLRRFRLFGFGGGREAVVVITFDGVADGFAPVVGVEGVDVFLLGDVGGLQESLGQVGDGAGGFGFYIAADNGGGGAWGRGAGMGGGGGGGG